jgi:hypothetical protein
MICLRCQKTIKDNTDLVMLLVYQGVKPGSYCVECAKEMSEAGLLKERDL